MYVCLFWLTSLALVKTGTVFYMCTAPAEKFLAFSGVEEVIHVCIIWLHVMLCSWHKAPHWDELKIYHIVCHSSSMNPFYDFFWILSQRVHKRDSTRVTLVCESKSFKNLELIKIHMTALWLIKYASNLPFNEYILKE